MMLLCKIIIIAKSREVKTYGLIQQKNLGESSKEGHSSKMLLLLLLLLLLMMMITLKLILNKENEKLLA
jgi:hypothetical protein